MTSSNAGYFKHLKVKTDKSLEKDLSEGIFSDSEHYELSEHYCNLLKAMVLAMYPKAQREQWYQSKEEEILPQEYMDIIPKLKEIIRQIKP